MSEEEAALQAEGAVQQEHAGAAALTGVAAAAAAAADRSGGSRSPLSVAGEYGEGTSTDEQAGAQPSSLPGRRHSGGSISTLGPGEWGGSGEEQLQQGGGGFNSSMFPGQQAALGIAALLRVGGDLGQQSRGRRNPRQQEQNKQAQQRYRAKRKAQFEELQHKVQLLSEEASAAQCQRQENEALRAEMARLKTLLHAATVTPGGGAAVAAAGAGLLDTHPSAGSLADPSCKPQPRNGVVTQQQGSGVFKPTATACSLALSALVELPGPGTAVSSPSAAAPPPQPRNGVVAQRQGSGAFKPTATACSLALSKLVELPGPSTAASSPQTPQLTGTQVQGALSLYYQDLQAFASSVQLEAMPIDGAGLGTEASRKLGQLVHTGIELIRMVLHASGPDATALLTAGMALVGPDGTSPADSFKQWQVVAVRVALTSEQHTALADWCRRFLDKIDDCYGRRLLHKAQLTQLPGTSLGGQPQQWVEALLLQAAKSVGFSACAVACAQLDDVVAALSDNLCEERSTACAMMAELLDHILTKVQAARFLLAGHPFCWNGLSFAHAVAAMQQHTASAQQQQQQQEPLAQLLVQHG